MRPAKSRRCVWPGGPAALLLLVLAMGWPQATQGEPMAVSAQLTLKDVKLLMQQSTNVVAELKNTGPGRLADVNPTNNGGSPDLLIRDLAGGAVTTLRSRREEGGDPTPVDVEAASSIRDEFFLSDRFEFPAPGEYEITARYVWNDGAGEASSPPVVVEVLPAHPREADFASARGTIGPVTLAAWVHTPDPARPAAQLWLSEIVTTGKPKVRQCTFLADLPTGAHPVLSVPPGGVPAAQWIAWVQDQKLGYLVHLHGDVTRPRSAPLAQTDSRIVPPLFQHPVDKGRILPGADVLLYGRTPGAADSQWVTMHLSSTSENRTGPPVPMPGPAPRWMESACLPGGTRHTCLIVGEAGTSELRVTTWSGTRPFTVPQHLAAWEGRCIAGSLVATAESQVLGAALLESGEGGSRRYVLQLWSLAEEFDEGPAIPVTLPGPGTGIEQAVLSVNADGEVHALLQTSLKGKPWLYCTMDGQAVPLPPQAGRLQLPAKVLFRAGVEPTVMYAVPMRGFQFVKP